MVSSARRFACGLTAAAAITGCSSGRQSVDTGGAGAVEQPRSTVVLPSSTLKTVDEIEGMNIPGPEGPMVRVSDDTGKDTAGHVGFVYRAAVFPDVGAPRAADVAPVYDSAERGATVIAYWGNGLGWLDKALVESRDFNYEEVLATRR